MRCPNVCCFFMLLCSSRDGDVCVCCRAAAADACCASIVTRPICGSGHSAHNRTLPVSGDTSDNAHPALHGCFRGNGVVWRRCTFCSGSSATAGDANDAADRCCTSPSTGTCCTAYCTACTVCCTACTTRKGCRRSRYGLLM